MKGIRHIVAAAILLLTMPVEQTQAQTQNAQALYWLKTGLAEKELAKKITAYQKAIALDSLLVEAMYNLGLAYKKQQNFSLAEKWFAKAYTAKPEKLANELKQQILTELGKTYKKTGKLRDSEEALKAAKAVAVDRATRATISFELGRCLYEQNRYDEALAELREGQKLSITNEAIFQNFIRLIEDAVASQRLYVAAEEALQRGNTNQAQALVEELQKKKPAEKNVERLVAKLDSSLKIETERNVQAALYEQAQKETAAGNLEAAITAYETLQQSGGPKDVSAELAAARQQLAAKQLQGQLEDDYAAGMSALREQNWTPAIFAFEKVLKVDENFRDVRQRLEEAERQLEKESTDNVIARYYVDGISALKRNDLGNALAAFEKVRRLNSHYRNVADYLNEIDQRLQQQIKPAAVAPEKIESLYQEALTAREQKEWMQALVALEKLQLLQANYREAATLLAEARSQFVEAQKNTASDGGTAGSLLAIVGMTVAVVTFPLLVVAAFSSTTRARLHLWRGNLPAAARLCENILSRHPERVKLYPMLANLYLLMRRHDEQAMKIYQAVLNLNIATQRYEEINAIVAQKYLTEGRTDSDAITVLENALKAERLKQKSEG
jgi:tetratricopeptide (TPR) repeat protein